MRLKTALLAALLLALSTPVAAQQSVVERVKSELIAAGHVFTTNCDAFEIVRRVACETGASLVPKFGSQNGCYPPGHPNGYSHDAIAFGLAPAGPWFDILASAGPPANGNRPVWNRVDPYQVTLVEPWGCGVPVPAPVPIPTPTPTPEPSPVPLQPLPSIDLSPLLNSQQVLAYKIGELQTLIETLRAELRAFVEHEDQRWAKVNAVWKKVVAIVGAAGPAIVTAILKLTGK